MTKCSLKHVDRIHENVKYPCNECEHKATTQGSLKIHIESMGKSTISINLGKWEKLFT